MKLADFEKSPSGRLVETINGFKAFIPDPLPPDLDYETLLPDLQAATLALGELNGAIEPIANPELVIRPMQYREAISSSSMEGTYTTFGDLMLFDATGKGEKEKDTKEVHNYLEALRSADELLIKLPICGRLVSSLHEHLLSGISKRSRGAKIVPGRFKEHQNFIGGPRENPRFIPPPPNEASKSLDELEIYINETSKPGLALINAALIHYQFETIHPFPDGNGRVGRILIPVYLKSVGVIDGSYFYMSEYFERNKDEYIDRMYDVSSTSAWTPWIQFFLRGVEESSRTAIVTAKKLMNCGEFFRQEIRDNRGKSAMLSQIMDQFLATPVLTVPTLKHRLGASDQTIRNNLAWLIKHELLREFDDMRPKFYFSPHVMGIISGQDDKSSRE